MNLFRVNCMNNKGFVIYVLQVLFVSCLLSCSMVDDEKDGTKIISSSIPPIPMNVELFYSQDI